MWQEGPIDGVHIRKIPRHRDDRGWLCELFRMDELYALGVEVPAMGYISLTRAHVTRGPHEHASQTDVFVFPHDCSIFLWDARKNSRTEGFRFAHDVVSDPDSMTMVVVPPGVVHAYALYDDGYVFNFPDKLYAGPGKKEEVDEIRHEDDPESPYELW